MNPREVPCFLSFRFLVIDCFQTFHRYAFLHAEFDCHNANHTKLIIFWKYVIINFLASLWSQQASLWSQQESLWSQQASLWSQMMHTFDSTIHRMEHFQLENNLSFHIYCMYSKTLYGTKLYKGKNVHDYFLILFLHLLSKQFFL